MKSTDHALGQAVRHLRKAKHENHTPIGALGLAALTRERDLQRGRRVSVILSGDNVDASTLAEVLAGRTPAPSPTAR